MTKKSFWVCPECSCDNRLSVIVQVFAKLTQSGDNFETELNDSEYTFNDNSYMRCSCGFNGIAYNFTPLGGNRNDRKRD